jgi:hypothetical protein
VGHFSPGLGIEILRPSPDRRVSAKPRPSRTVDATPQNPASTVGSNPQGDWTPTGYGGIINPFHAGRLPSISAGGVGHAV